MKFVTFTSGLRILTREKAEKIRLQLYLRGRQISGDVDLRDYLVRDANGLNVRLDAHTIREDARPAPPLLVETIASLLLDARTREPLLEIWKKDMYTA